MKPRVHIIPVLKNMICKTKRLPIMYQLNQNCQIHYCMQYHNFDSTSSNIMLDNDIQPNNLFIRVGMK